MIALSACLVAALALCGGAVPDSVRPLTFDEFYRVVASNHPVVQQARLLESIAEGQERQAWGAFDPTLSAKWEGKRYGGTRYYDYRDLSLSIPTPIGVDLKLGYERTSGQYFAADRRTPTDGLLTAGISIPLGQRMLIDERRNAVAQARAMRDYAQGERAAQVNKVLLTAAKLYGQWYEAYRRQRLTAEALALADTRLAAIRRRVQQGDAAALDTIEARLELQKRAVLRLEANIDWRNASIMVEGLLWTDGMAPMRLDSLAVPSLDGLEAEAVDPAQVMEWLAIAERRHPTIVKATAKIREAESERRLAGQQVWVPRAELSYTPIAARGDGFDGVFDATSSSENGKWGGALKLPLLALKERGKVTATSGKLDQLRFELALSRRDVAIAVTTAANDLIAVDSLLQLQRVTVVQSRMLRDGEQRKFEVGESTLFLVNTRERQLIDEEIKRIALESKYVSARAALAVAIGEPARLPVGR